MRWLQNHDDFVRNCDCALFQESVKLNERKAELTLSPLGIPCLSENISMIQELHTLGATEL